MIKFKLRSLIGKWEAAHNEPLSLTRVAKETGISRTTVSRHANNSTSNGTLDTIDAYCRFFECTVSDVLEYVPDPDANAD